MAQSRLESRAGQEKDPGWLVAKDAKDAKEGVWGYLGHAAEGKNRQEWSGEWRQQRQVEWRGRGREGQWRLEMVLVMESESDEGRGHKKVIVRGIKLPGPVYQQRERVPRLAPSSCKRQGRCRAAGGHAHWPELRSDVEPRNRQVV